MQRSPFEDMIASLPAQYEDVQYKDKVLLVDGDFFIYRAAANATSLKQAITRFYKICLTEAFIVGVDNVRCYITPSACKKCDRRLYPSVLEYQANRLVRQYMPYKESLKKHLIDNPNEYANKNISIHYSDYFEADDLLVMDSYKYKHKSILSSCDKDLRLTPYPFWEDKIGQLSEINNTYGHIRLDLTTVAPNIKGHGIKFFHAQLLMGDQVDNVRGLKSGKSKTGVDVGIGVMRTWNILKDFNSEEESLRTIIGMYKRINQNVLAEAEMLWLRRNDMDSAYQYFLEFDFKREIMQYIDDCNDKNMHALEQFKLNGVSPHEETRHDAEEELQHISN